MFLDILSSLYQLTGHIFFGNKPDVLLYYPQHFNRSINGTNPYYDPIIAICKDHKINFLILEEPDNSTSYPRNPQCIKADALFWLITIMRKLFNHVYRGKTFVEIDSKIARILDKISLNKLRAKRYITISNSMINILAELNPDGIVYDYQHGIIFNGHNGYFVKKDCLSDSYTKLNRCIMLWGDLYLNIFSKTLPKNELHKRIKIVGYPITSNAFVENVEQERMFIVISLQITSNNKIWSKHSLMMLEECLNQLKPFRYKVLLKHHPRFNNIVDVSYIIKNYPFVEFTSKSLAEIAPQTLLHITWCSTTCFEYANYGVPTFFLIDEIIPYGLTIFYEQYNYPLYMNTRLTDVMNRISDHKIYQNDCTIVKNWYNRAYSQFDKQQMLKILTAHED